jgi:paraquat-inducible protein A
MQYGLQGCEDCGLLSRPAPDAKEGRCPRCGEELVFRKRDSLQRTWAFVIGAAICYLPANMLPVLTTTTAAGSESDTILQGVVLLWSPTGWPLSLIVLFASIMIPSAKILALMYLLITVQRGSIENNAQRARLYRVVDFIGRWSMVDVFVDAFTAALVQLQPLMSVAPAPGLFFFTAVVVLTMLGVEVGTLTSIRLSDDHQTVVTTAQMARPACRAPAGRSHASRDRAPASRLLRPPTAARSPG